MLKFADRLKSDAKLAIQELTATVRGGSQGSGGAAPSGPGRVRAGSRPAAARAGTGPQPT